MFHLDYLGRAVFNPDHRSSGIALRGQVYISDPGTRKLHSDIVSLSRWCLTITKCIVISNFYSYIEIVGIFFGDNFNSF